LWILGGLLVVPAVWYGVNSGPSGWVVMSGAVACIAFMPVVFKQLIPLGKDLRTSAIDRGQFRRVASIRSVDSFWTAFSILLCLTPFYVLLVFAHHFPLSNALSKGVDIAAWLLTTVFKGLLVIPVIGFLCATVVPWTSYGACAVSRRY
jgi:hypothetical protein